MSGLVDKVKDKVGSGSGPSTGGSSGGSSGGSNSGLKQGSKLPTIGALKENSPTEGSVDLSQLKGKSTSNCLYVRCQIVRSCNSYLC